MKPQIQLSFFLPETIPQDSAFPIRVATFKLTPPGGRRSVSVESSIALARDDAGEVEGYAILWNGERVDPETIDTLPEATMRAALAYCTNVIPQWLHKHIREYATRAGLETAFLRRPGYRPAGGIEEDDGEYAADTPDSPELDPQE